MEKIVAKQLNNYLLHFNILDPKQSVFKNCHSTETTLISLTDDILWTLIVTIIYNCYFWIYHQL